MMHRVISVVLVAALVGTGCRTETVVDPASAERHREARSAERQAEAAVDEAEAEVEVVRAQHDVLAAQISDDESAEAAKIAAYERSVSEVKKYRDTIERAKDAGKACQSGRKPEGDIVAAYRYLNGFESEPDRDTAIAALESCRKALVKVRKREIRDAISVMRDEFAVGLEDQFDEDNPYSRGTFKASVKGSTLMVKMQGNFEGRKRHSQSQVDAWCESAFFFTSIVLRNSHGTFRCKPEDSSKATTEVILAEDGILEFWVPPVGGEKPAPSMIPPPPSPPPNGGPKQHELADELQTLQASLLASQANVELKKAEHNKLSARVERYEREESERLAEQRKGEEAAAKRIVTAGYITGGIGLLSASIGGYMAYQRIDTNERIVAAKQAQTFGGGTNLDALETEAEKQTLGLAVGLGVGLPLIAAGVVLVIVGRRRVEASKVALTPSGLALKF